MTSFTSASSANGIERDWHPRFMGEFHEPMVIASAPIMTSMSPLSMGDRSDVRKTFSKHCFSVADGLTDGWGVGCSALSLRYPTITLCLVRRL